MGKLKVFVNSVLAGFLIGVAGTVFLSVDNTVLGALLFSFGLLFIIYKGFFLYTGKIGALNIKAYPSWVGIMLVGNYLGTLLESMAVKLTKISSIQVAERAANIANAKLNDDILSVFIRAIFCGILMYLAASCAEKRPVAIMFPVVVFVLTGFEHSIANMFYFNLAWCWSIKSVAYIVVTVIGNTIGARVFHYLATFDIQKFSGPNNNKPA